MVADRFSDWLHEASVLIMIFGLLEGFLQHERHWWYRPTVCVISLVSFGLSAKIKLRKGVK